MTLHMKRALIRVTHNNVLATLFLLAGILETTTLVITGVRGESVSALNAGFAALIGGGVVWSYLAVTGKLKGV